MRRETLGPTPKDSMKIAFLISAGRFPSGILQELRAQLPQHQLIHWPRGESSPATDIEVLLSLVMEAMKRGAILVNIARGSLVDESALYDLLKSGHIAAAGLDVLKSRPDGAKSPLVDLPQILITPHIAGATDLTFRGTLNYIKQVIEAFAAGERPKSILNAPAKPRRLLR
jgi:D-isomer specific 2-hydroxyacid dehydrogenase, NAD binding domain